MDLTQSKLTRTEWDSIEIPVSENEREILSLIMEGFSNINISNLLYFFTSDNLMFF
jgi:ATP/maltotriose-dependent transcriptional regulator MalT